MIYRRRRPVKSTAFLLVTVLKIEIKKIPDDYDDD
jgi:hypothetical protein